MKSAKNLLVPFVILIALIIGVIVYFVVENSGNVEVSEASSGLKDIIYYNSADIASLTVFNRDTGHKAMIKNSVDANGKVYYEYLGDDAVTGEKYSQYHLADFESSMASFSVNSKVSSGNLGEYGLDNPAFTITINAVNGSVTTVYLGNSSPDGRYCYMYYSGSSDVYTIGIVKLSEASKTGIDFLDATIFSIDSSDLTSVHFDRQSDKLSLDAEVSVDSAGNTSFQIVKPYNHGTSSYFANMIRSVANLQVNDYVEINGSELSSYGLKTPEYHFILNVNDGQTMELFFSKSIGGYIYGYMTGLDKYFKLADYQLENVEMQELILIDPYICYCYPYEYASISGTYGEKQFKFDLDVNKDKSLTDDESSVTMDGRNAKISDSKGRSYASMFFESISCIKIGGVEVKNNIDTSSGSVLTITFLDKSYNATVYEFYTRDSDSYYAFKNGEYMGFYVYSRELFFDAGTDTYNYGCWSAYELLNTAISSNINGTYDIPTE